MIRNRTAATLMAAALLAAAAIATGCTPSASPAPALAVAAADVQGAPVIPLPAVVQPAEGRFVVDATTAVRAPGDAAGRVATQFTELLARTTPLRLADGQGPGIEFRIVPAAAGTSPEAYTLHIGDEGISVQAGDEHGLFNGEMTLWQLIAGPQTNAL